MAVSFTSVFAILYYCICATTSDATLSLLVDNSVEVYISPTGVETSFTLIGTMNSWPTQLVITIPEIDITPSTIIQFRCVDAGQVGGFIANLNYNSINDY
eukprot:369013_1